jgi:hypothetical protein
MDPSIVSPLLSLNCLPPTNQLCNSNPSARKNHATGNNRPLHKVVYANSGGHLTGATRPNAVVAASNNDQVAAAAAEPVAQP